jgi:drug/metabolite transporter (DMT)-like permease
MTQKQKVIIALFFSMLFWGFSFIWTTEALKTYNPLSTIFFRLIISVTFMLIINIWYKSIKRIEKQDFKWFLLLSFFQPFLYFIGENYGLVHASPTTTSVIISTIPLFAPIAAYVFLKEKITLINFFAIIISIVGVFLVIFKEDFSISTSSTGLLLLTLSVFSAVTYSVILVKLSGKYHVFTILFTQNLLGTILFAPLFIIVDFKDFISVGFNIQGFIPIFKLAIFASTLSYLFFIYGVKNIGITKTNIFANIIPAFTAIFSYFIIGETLTFINILGIFIVIFGVLITQIKFGTLFARN